MNSVSTLIIIVPCYNEAQVLNVTFQQLTDILRQLEEEGKIGCGKLLFVDDGSTDTTWNLIRSMAQTNSYVSGLKLAHNVGHQQALWAGLERASTHCDITVSIDADLQDDVCAITKMVEHFNQGKDIVYGVRKERKTDSFFKRNSALLFYQLMKKMGGDIVYNHADFRLISRRALQALLSYPERNLFLRGMVCLIGYPSATVYYDRKERFAGESKYPFTKMLNFALDGVTSFSIKPLRMIMTAGLVFILISIIVIIHALVSYREGAALPGWTSMQISIWFIGGCILTALGIIGEYIGKIYKEVKHRPHYFIEEEINL